jgi:hypothetical protein
MSWITNLLPIFNTIALVLIAFGYWRSNRSLQEQRALLDLTSNTTVKNIEHYLSERRNIEQRLFDVRQAENNVIEEAVRRLQHFKNTMSLAQMLLIDEESTGLWPIKEAELASAIENIQLAHSEMLAKFSDTDLRLLHSAKQAAAKLVADIKLHKAPKANTAKTQSLVARIKILHGQCTDVQSILRDMLNARRYLPQTEGE